jgi:hypothetical protein
MSEASHGDLPVIGRLDDGETWDRGRRSATFVAPTTIMSLTVNTRTESHVAMSSGLYPMGTRAIAVTSFAAPDGGG